MQNAFVLHTRPYRDTSLLVEFFTEQAGRLTAVARGARRQKSTFRGVLQPFNQLLIDTVGKHELQTLCHAESTGQWQLLTGEALYCGFYLNELLMRVLIQRDPYSNLFHQYAETLTQLQQQKPEQVLRIFEKRLLNYLGYGLHLSHAEGDQWYYYDPEQGIKLTLEQQSQGHIFLGQSLLDVENEQFTSQQSLRDAKRLMRIALAPLLGNKPLKSRELFILSTVTKC